MKVMFRIFSMLILTSGLTFAQPQYKVIYNFNGTDGYAPGSLIFDQSGNIFGTTAFGGNSNSDCTNGTHASTALINAGGSYPLAALVLGNKVIYGATSASYPAPGTIF